MFTSEIIEITSGKPGPTLAIFAGVHGNETAGVLALEEVIPELKLAKGKIFLAYANPPALAKNVRMINKNLNRCFYKGNNGNTPEDVRARELMNVLDKCDALLDIHMFYDDDGSPFVICEENAIKVAEIFDVDVISTNWTETEPGGADGYMFENGKIGICLECGPISKAAEYKNFAKVSIYQYLSYYGLINNSVGYSLKKKRIIKSIKAVIKDTELFSLLPGFTNFQKLNAGELIAKNKDIYFIAKKNECIIFPHYNARVGEEAYIIGVEQLN